MIKVYCEQGSELWHSAKLGLITGTRFATLMSAKSTKGYQDLINTIAGEIITGEKEETYSNDIMERGIEMESEAVEMYESIFGIETEEIGLCLVDENKTGFEWVGVSPDRLVNPDGGLEIKCPLLKTHLSYIQDNKLPSVYKWQVQGALYVTERKWWDFMSYFPKTKPFIIRVYPDVKMHEDLESRIKESIEEIKTVLSNYDKYDYL